MGKAQSVLSEERKWENICISLSASFSKLNTKITSFFLKPFMFHRKDLTEINLW